MNEDRFVVLGLARPRAGWFRELARWSTAAAIPVDFVKCVSPAEVQARLGGGRAYSTLLVGGDIAGLDRDLVDAVRSAGASVIVVDPPAERNWRELGVAGLLPATFDRATLLASLAQNAAPIAPIATAPEETAGTAPASWRGRLIAVTGPGGAGTSITAMAIAQSLAADASNRAMVLLADLALDAEQALLHDAEDIVPGVQEIVEAHRAGRLPTDRLRSLVFDAIGHGYHVLLGLRRHRDWTAIAPRTFAASLDSLLHAYRWVIADIDEDLEGEQETGSRDIEDRNQMARLTATRADVVVVVGNPTTKGLHSLTRTIRGLATAGIPAERIVPVLNRAPRSRRRRAEATGALATLARAADTGPGPGNPVFLPERGDLEDAIRDGIRLPPSLGRPLHAELRRRLDELQPQRGEQPADRALLAPVPVIPGTLGTWTEESR